MIKNIWLLAFIVFLFCRCGTEVGNPGGDKPIYNGDTDNNIEPIQPDASFEDNSIVRFNQILMAPCLSLFEIQGLGDQVLSSANDLFEMVSTDDGWNILTNDTLFAKINLIDEQIDQVEYEQSSIDQSKLTCGDETTSQVDGVEIVETTVDFDGKNYELVWKYSIEGTSSTVEEISITIGSDSLVYQKEN